MDQEKLEKAQKMSKEIEVLKNIIKRLKNKVAEIAIETISPETSIYPSTKVMEYKEKLSGRKNVAIDVLCDSFKNTIANLFEEELKELVEEFKQL